jgi:serine/threonine protein kinase
MDVPHIIAGRFRIECEIGTGGMGTVYRATHLGLERPVAVKIIKPEFASDPDVTERFMREARTMAKLRHPRAAMIFDAGNLPDGRHFIVMEFVEGSTLSETLQREKRFSPERAVRIAADICEVLGEAHKLGIIHRDLKPSNIMLSERGVCVLDFGVAKVLVTSADATSTHATTGSGVIVGTPRYMSPEQCLGQTVGARSDLYSLGVLVYEMLAGRPPFIDPLPSVVLVKQATAAPPPLPKMREDLPRPLALAVHTLLAKRAEDRPSSADAARKLLEKSIARPARVVPEAQPFASTVAAQGRPARSIALSAFMSLTIIGTLGVLLVVWGRSALNSSATPQASNVAQAQVASRDMSASGAGEAVNLPRTLTVDEARRFADSISHGSISDIRVVRAGRDSRILAVNDEGANGTSRLFVMQRRGTRYRVIARAPLDVPDFRGADWTAETMDADGDGHDEVLYTGKNPESPARGRRLVLYVPRTRTAYTLLLEDYTRDGKPVRRATWSPNALTRKATYFRTVLQQRAREKQG